MVCFMWNLQHYVAFCRRQVDPSMCLFFNDLPELTPEAPGEADWSSVPAMCSRYSMTPRLVLYESTKYAHDLAQGDGEVRGSARAA
jgi:hypothetical protein